MKSYKIYLLLGLLLGIAAVVFYVFDQNSAGGKFMAPQKWKEISVFEDYSLEIMKFMKEGDLGDLHMTEKQEYENLIREIFITIEQYPIDELEEGNNGDEKQVFEQALLKLRKETAKPIFTTKGQMNKELSPSSALGIPQMNAAWFSMVMAGEKGTTATFHVFALYEHEGHYFLLRAATNRAFRDTYEASFLRMIQSFKSKKII
jgi:hypothetical protein